METIADDQEHLSIKRAAPNKDFDFSIAEQTLVIVWSERSFLSTLTSKTHLLQISRLLAELRANQRYPQIVGNLDDCVSIS